MSQPSLAPQARPKFYSNLAAWLSGYGYWPRPGLKPAR